MKFFLKNIFAACAFFITIPLVFAGGFFLSVFAILAAPFVVVGILIIFGYFAIASRRQGNYITLSLASGECSYIYFEDFQWNVIYLSDHVGTRDYDGDLAITG